MLDLITELKYMPPRALPKYHLFLKEQNKILIKQYRKFFDKLGHESNGIKKLIYLLQFVDLDYMDTQVNNFDRYYYHVHPLKRNLMNTFDTTNRKGFKFLFFKNLEDITTEYLLPIDDIYSVINLPLETNDWKQWRKVRPLRIWANDSRVLSTRIINDKICYKHDSPSYCIELLDVSALIMKYYIWSRYYKKYEINQELVTYVPKQYFLHRYVLCDVIWDLANSWVTNVTSDLLSKNNRDEVLQYSHQLSEGLDLQYEYLVRSYETGLVNLWDTFIKARTTIRPEVLLSSKLFFDGSSINDRIDLVKTALPLPANKRYDYLRYLRDKELFNLYIDTLLMRPQLQSTRSFIINLDRMYKRMLNRKPWSYPTNPIMKGFIETEMNQTYDKIHQSKLDFQK